MCPVSLSAGDATKSITNALDGMKRRRWAAVALRKATSIGLSTSPSIQRVGERKVANRAKVNSGLGKPSPALLILVLGCMASVRLRPGQLRREFFLSEQFSTHFHQVQS
jgi:hypothetical protein